jgi:hypothetical protein
LLQSSGISAVFDRFSAAQFAFRHECARALHEAAKPYAADINFMPEDETDRLGSACGPNYRRLAEMKRRYDSQNLFRVNQNVRPMAEAHA